MYIDHNEISDYPFVGKFFRNIIDESLPLDEQVEVENMILETPCDIMEASHSRSKNFISASYMVYFPIGKEEDSIQVRKGDTFRGQMYGLPIDGKVIGLFPSQLGGCLAYIEDLVV